MPSSRASSLTRRGLSSAVDLNNDAGVNWNNLEVKFTTLLGFLNAPVANGGNGTNLVQQRELQQESYEIGLEAIIEVALSETNMLLQVGDFKGAIVGGLKSLNFVQQLYGSNALEQIEPYFLLAKANQCLKRYEQSEEFLSIASWTIMKTVNTPYQIKAELHLNFGLLYVSKGEIEKATEHLATSVYYLALLHGTDHLITSFGYFNLGNVFATQGKMDKAIDFLRKVIEIWHSQLIKSVNKETEEDLEKKEQKPMAVEPEEEKSQGFLRRKFDATKPQENSLESLDEEKIFEANRMFEHILNIEMDRYGENNIETGKVFMVYGLYQYWIGEVVKSKEYLEKALAVFKYVLGEKHSSTMEIKDIIMRISQ